MNPRKVVIYFDSPFFSGAEMQAARNATHAASLGHKVTVVYRDRGDLGTQLRQRMSGLPITFLCLTSGDPLRRLGSPRLQELLREPYDFCSGFLNAVKISERTTPDTIHINNGGYPGSPGARGFALGSTLFSKAPRILFSVNNLAVPYSQPMRLVQAPVDKMLSRSRIMWITASQSAGRRLTRVLSLRHEKLMIIPNGIPTLKCTCKAKYIQHSFAIEPDSVVAAQIGHLEPRKGHLTLLNAINRLKIAGNLPSNWKFLLEGEGPSRQLVNDKLEEYGLSASVALLGRVNCVYHLLSVSDILIHPSTSNEDLPNVISEAMSLGIPVIGSNVGGIAEQIADEVTGLVVGADDHVLLSSAILELMSSQGRRDSMGSMALKRFETFFSEALAHEAYQEAYFGREDSQ